MRYVTSGESHGEQMTLILEGVPSNLTLNLNAIQMELKRRQSGVGRGGRMAIETDEVKIVSGVLFGKTTGSPICFVIKNRDFIHHESYMTPFSEGNDYQKIDIPRPGHADLVGAIKYGFDDTRLVFERASARETVGRVVVGAIAKQILQQVGIQVVSYVKSIGPIESLDGYSEKVETSPVRMPDHSKEAIDLILSLIEKKDTVGGICVAEAHHVPMGLGSYVSHETKLDAAIASSFLSIQSCKGVSFGDGFQLGRHFGSETHDEILYEAGFTRKTNHYGGFEGGMTTGMPIVVQAVFKPIPTLMQPLNSVSMKSKEVKRSHIERSDTCVLPAASVICEHTLAFEVANALLNQFTSDTMNQLIQSVENYRQDIKRE